MSKGIFITFEGIDGSGKSTQIQYLKEYFSENGIEAVFTRDPGGTQLGEELRSLILHSENEMRQARKKFQKLHPDIELPNITPHVFRHTFCTNLANAGMDIKNLQYLMGHSDVGVTLNVYSHSSYDHAADQLQKLAPIVRFHIPENTSEFTPDLTPNLTPIFTKTWRKMAQRCVEL